MPLTKAAKSANDSSSYGSADGRQRLIFICPFLQQRSGELSYGREAVLTLTAAAGPRVPDRSSLHRVIALFKLFAVETTNAAFV